MRAKETGIMKVKFDGMTATAKPDTTGETFSISVLETLREQAIGKQLSVNFLHVLDSEVESARLTDNIELYIAGWVDISRSPLGIQWSLYPVPGYVVDEDGEFDQLVEFGLTYTPADENLTPIKFSEFGG